MTGCTGVYITPALQSIVKPKTPKPQTKKPKTKGPWDNIVDFNPKQIKFKFKTRKKSIFLSAQTLLYTIEIWKNFSHVLIT